MPIRINLLAEAQAAEEERRKDPVKRSIYGGVAVVSLVLVWAALLQTKVMSSNRQLSAIDSKWKSLEKDYEAAVSTHRKNMETEEKLTALRVMSTNRFLWGNVLNAFQHTLNNLDNVQVTRLKAEQSYAVVEATPSRTNGTTVVRGKPGSATEKIAITLDATDSSSHPGSRVTLFKDAIGNQKFFQERLSKTNGLLLINRSAPQSTAASANQFVTFTLKCSFPEKTR